MTTLFQSLREWSDDDLHLLQSVRFHEPTFANPGEIRAAVRELLAAHDDLLDHQQSHVEANAALAAQAKWRSEPEVARVMDELDDFVSVLGQGYAHSKQRMPADLLKVCQLATSVTTRMRSHYRITSGRDGE